MQDYSDEEIIDLINNGNISFLRCTQSDQVFLKSDEMYANLRFHTGDLQWTRIFNLKVQLLQTQVDVLKNEISTNSQTYTSSTNQSPNPPGTEQTDTSINGNHSINQLASWKKLVSQLSTALNNAINLDELRENFSAIVENIEEDHSHSVHKGPRERENALQTNKLIIPAIERSHSIIQSAQAFQLKDSTSKVVEADMGRNLFKCNYCSKTFTYNHNLKVHIKNHINVKPFSCSHCPKSFVTSRKLELHTRTHTGEKPYKCHLCDKAFALKHNCQIHLRTHTGEKPFQCSYCGKAFSTQGNCNDHMKRHSGEKPYQCNHCGKGFTISTDLKYHMRQHTGEKPFKCSKCDVAFTLRKNLNWHMNSHSEVKPFKCTYCEKSFATNYDCNTHLKTHEKKKKTETEKKQKPFKCSHCDQGFDTEILCSAHMKKHDVPYQCNICVKGFDSINKLFTHMKNHSKKQYQCNHCSKAFRIEKSLKRHIKIHTQCDNTFVNENSINEHQSDNDEDNNEEKTYQCSQCDAFFNSNSELIYHKKDIHNFNDDPLMEALVCLKDEI